MTPRAAERLYRRLIRFLLPAAFRREAEAELLEVFRDAHRRATGRGPLACLRLWIRLALDLLVTAAAEAGARRRVVRGRGRSGRPSRTPPRAMALHRLARTLAQDLRFASLRLLRKPGRAALAAGTLGVGVAASLVMVVLVRDILLRPLPFEEPERLVRLVEASDGGRRFWPSWPNTRDWREHAMVFEGVVAAEPPTEQPVVLGDRSVRVSVGRVSLGFLDVLGVRPALGREFTASENAPGGDAVALVSWSFWRSAMGGGPLDDLSFTLGQDRYRVVGVLPPDFRFLAYGGVWGDAAVWTPLERSQELGGRTSHGYHVVGRLSPGVGLEGARADLNALAIRLKESHGESTHADRIVANPLLDDVVGGVRDSLRLLLLAALLVLLVGCMNLAAALLAQGIGRARELAIRMALGAGRGGVSRQLLLEALLLAVPGLLAGTGLAWLGLGAVRLAGAASLPRLEAVGLDAGDVAVAGALALAAALVAGVLPALSAARQAGTELRARGGGSEGSRSRGLWRLFVAGQVALTVVLVIGCGLLLRSFVAAVNVDLGYRPDDVLSVDIALPESPYEAHERRLAYWAEALRLVRSLPGVRAAGLVQVPTPDASWPTGPIGRADDEETHFWTAFRLVDDGYFEAIGIPHLRGARLPAAGAGEPDVLIDRNLAEGLWPGRDPLGERLEGGAAVAGIVGSVREWHQERGNAAVYVDYRSAPERILSMYLMVRHDGDAAASMERLRTALSDLDPLVPLVIHPMRERLLGELTDRRFLLAIAAVFAAVTLLLAAVGVYAVVAFAVNRRLREAAIRVAVGAEPARVSRRLMGFGMGPALIGVGLGVLAAIPAASALRSQLFQVQRFDPLVFGSAALVLAVTASAAAWVPARRAGRVDPALALREE